MENYFSPPSSIHNTGPSMAFQSPSSSSSHLNQSPIDLIRLRIANFAQRSKEMIENHKKLIEDIHRRQFDLQNVDDDTLRTTLAFNNPGASSYLAQSFHLPISQRLSFLRDFHNVTYPDDEYFKHLRKTQSAENARQSVEEGVKYLKSGAYLEAQQCLNKALQIDCDNLDALVARGCLFANTHSLIKAAEDFDKALSIDPEHVNARKYMSETLHEIGKLYEEEGDFDNAIKSYRRSCQVNVKNNEALEALKSVIEKRGSWRSRSSEDELKNMYRDIKEKSYYETCHKLTLLLEEDKKRGRQTTRNRSRSKPRSSSTSSSQSSDSSSGSIDDSSTSSSDSSSSSNGSNRRSRKKKKSKKSKSKKSKRRKEKKRKKRSKDSISSIPGIKIHKSKDSITKEKKSSDTVSRIAPKMPSPKISFTIKKIEPENRTLKATKPFASSSKAPTSRNPITEKIVYNLDKLKPVPIEFVRNGPIEKPNEPKNNRKSPPTRPRSRSRGRMYIPGRSRSPRSPVRPRRRSRSRSRGRWRRGRSRSHSRSRAICRAVVKRRSRSPKRSPSSEKSKRSSQSRATPTWPTNDVSRKVTDEAKKIDEFLKDKGTSGQN